MRNLKACLTFIFLVTVVFIGLLPAVTVKAWAISPTFSPSNNATNVSVDEMPTLTFDETVYSNAERESNFPTGVIKVYEGTDNSGTPLIEDSDFRVDYDIPNNESTFSINFGAGLKYNQSYYVELQSDKIFDFNGNAIGSVQGATFKTEAEDDYTATINTYKDSSLSAMGTVELFRSTGTKNYTMDAGATGVFTGSVPNGTYDVYVNSRDTGKDITINGAPASLDLTYYTVKYDVLDVKYALDIGISATYDGGDIDSGTVVLGGKKLVITPRNGDGYVHDATYLWSGAGTNSQTSYDLTIPSLGEKVDATCTVTGESILSPLGSPTLIDGKYYYKNVIFNENYEEKTILICFSDNVTSGDAITLPTMTGFTVSPTSNDYVKRINIDSGIKGDALQEYIHNVGFTIASPSQVVSITITTEDIEADIFYNIHTQHYYQYVPYSSGTTGTWTDAYNAAVGTSYMHRIGYLATVKDKAEDQFLYELSGGATGWLGGTTDANRWYWACGPEKGNSFYSAQVKSDTSDSDSINAGYYFNWRRGAEPDNANTGQCLTTLSVSTSNGYDKTETGYQGTDFSWNNIADNTAYAGDGKYCAKGYFVEYGDKLQGDFRLPDYFDAAAWSSFRCRLNHVCTVTFNKNGGDVEANPSTEAAISGGNIGTLPAAPSRSGYTFAGWNTASNGGGDTFTTATAITSDKTVYAQWTLNTATDTEKVAADKASLAIGFAPGDNANSVTQDLTLPRTGAAYGSIITWSSNDTSVISTSGAVTRPAYASGDADVTVTATINCNGTGGKKDFSVKVLKFAQITHTVTFKDWDGSTLKTGTVNDGAGATAPSGMSRTGYTFIGWDKTFSNVTGDLTVTAQYSQNAVVTYAVTYDGNGGTGTAPTESSKGASATFATAANSFTAPSGKQFKEWNTTSGGIGTDYAAGATVTMPAYNLVLYAIWEDIPSRAGGGSGNGNGNTPSVTQETATSSSGNTVTATVTAKAAADGSGKASASVTQAQVSDVVKKAIEEAAKQGKGTAAVAEIKVEAAADAKTVETGLPKSAVDAVAASNTDALTVSTPIAAITFDSKALDTIAGTAATDVKISAAKVDASTLADDAKELVGDRPIFNFSVTSGDKTISQFEGNVSVSVPYTAKAGEDTDAIVIYYINSDGKPEAVPNCKYDPATKAVIFTTSHFSEYAVGYNKVSFSDVKDGAWYGNAVEFAAARGIVTGTGNGNFSPDAKLTRGQLLVMLMRAYGIAADSAPTDNFSDAGDTYYTGYLAAARKLGITSGVGNNMFAPGKEITRQEMFTLLYNTLKQIKTLPSSTTRKTLASYSDSNKIASWAKDAMSFFVGIGTVSGSGDQLNPSGTANRAEMAQTLYNLLKK